MRPRAFVLILIALALAACAPAATPAPTTAPAAPAPTQPPAPTSAAIAPPSSGGVVIAPTRSATATPRAGQVTSGRSGSGWQRIDADSPPAARYDHTLTLDAVNDKLVLFGGREGSTLFGDTWVYDLDANTWREVKTATAPEARFGHAAAFDAKSGRVLIFGGRASSFFNDVWAFDTAGETWQKIATMGTAPSARYGTSLAIDARTNQLIVTHGAASSRLDDTFALELATNTWSRINVDDDVPLKRSLHEAVYDARANRMILFGGCSSGFGPCPQGDLWSLDVSGRDWNEVIPQGVKPSPRSNPALVGDGAGRLILFGGLTSDGPIGDVWSLDIASGEWTGLDPSGSTPAARSSHDAVWNPETGQMIVFGGRGSAGALNDLWVCMP